MQHILVVGDPVNGFLFYGPFDDGDAVITYAEKYFASVEWWIAVLDPPTAQI